MSTFRRFIVLLNVAFMVAWVAFAVAAYDKLPARIPTHFGPSGAADAFSDRSIASWFAMTTIGICVTLLTLGLAQITQRRPSLYNIPGKEDLLSLPTEEQRPYLEQVALFMTLVSSTVVAIFAAIQYDMWKVATSDQQGLSYVSWSAIALCIGGTMLGTPFWLVRFQSRVAAAKAAITNGARRAS